ncbi:hypothetical protein EMCRGX_G010750 [Ephydatia muelleri]
MLRVFCFLASLTAASQCATLNVILTPSAVAGYGTSNPLLVNISDTIRFSCNGSVSNVIILASLQQWQSCDATTGGPPFLWAYCLTNTSIKTVTIIHQSNTVAGTFSFDEGQDYYLASFSDGTLNGAVHTAFSGGECSSGVKMVIRVRGFSIPTPSSSTSSTPTITSTSTIRYTSGMLLSTNSPSTPSSGTESSDTGLPGNTTALQDRVIAGLITTVVPAVSGTIGVALIGSLVLLVVLLMIRKSKHSDVKGQELTMGQDPTGSLRPYASRQDTVPLTCKENTSLTSETCKEMTSLTSNTILLEGVASQ